MIPYPSSADNHQFYNAWALVQTGAARMLGQERATPELLVEMLEGQGHGELGLGHQRAVGVIAIEGVDGEAGWLPLALLAIGLGKADHGAIGDFGLATCASTFRSTSARPRGTRPRTVAA